MPAYANKHVQSLHHLLSEQVDLQCNGLWPVAQYTDPYTWMELSPDCQVLAYSSAPFQEESGTTIVFHDLAKDCMTTARLEVEQDHVLLNGCWQVRGLARLC